MEWLQNLYFAYEMYCAEYEVLGRNKLSYLECFIID